MPMQALTALDSAAHDLVSAYAQREVLTVIVRKDGDQLRIICPAGHEAEIARALYHAADTMADHAPNPHR